MRKIIFHQTAQDAGVNSSLRNRKSREQDYSEDENIDLDEDGEIKKDILSEDEGIGEQETNSDEAEVSQFYISFSWYMTPPISYRGLQN